MIEKKQKNVIILRLVISFFTLLGLIMIPGICANAETQVLEGGEEDPSLQEFSASNEFCGCFRTSAKTGVNISESMEFLIKTIIKRMEDMQSKGNEVFTTERKSVALDPEKHNQAAATKRKKDKDGCC